MLVKEIVFSLTSWHQLGDLTQDLGLTSHPKDGNACERDQTLPYRLFGASSANTCKTEFSSERFETFSWFTPLHLLYAFFCLNIILCKMYIDYRNFDDASAK